MKQILALQISAKSKYVNIGVDDGEEIAFFELSFLTNSHNWGAVLTNPDGKSNIKLARYGGEISELTVPYENGEVSVDISYNKDKGMYEILLDTI